MALKIILDQYDEAGEPGVYTRELYSWDTVARQVKHLTKPSSASGATPPAGYSWPLEEPVDAYTVPPQGQPGYVAGKEGQYTSVFHDGEGGVDFAYADVCDLAVKNLRGLAPATAGGLGSVEFEATTTGGLVTARLTDINGMVRELGPVAAGLLRFEGLPTGPGLSGNYALVVEDARGCLVGVSPELYVSVPAAPPALVEGCMDEDASNYNAQATVSDGSCQYSPRWVGLWNPDGIRVDVAPVDTAVAFVAGEVYAGFPPGHPLAYVRPEQLVASVRATVSPRTGLASFDLAPYLRNQVGALLSDGTRRLDLSSPTAQTQDLLVGYRLRVAGRSVAHGYALNSALSEVELLPYGNAARPLSPFGKTLPVWPGYGYSLSVLTTEASGRFGLVELVAPENDYDTGQRLIVMPCPRNGLPVAWLAPEGGFGYWVFSGFHIRGDSVAEGEAYTEAGTQQLRISSRLSSRRTVEAYTGAFGHQELVEGLRTLRRSAQAWYQPEGPGSAWVPIVLKGGSFPAYRLGRSRYEATIQFTEAAPQYVQGQ